MFSVQIFLAYLFASQFCAFTGALFVRNPSFISITQAQDLSSQNTSKTLASFGHTTFPIPDSSLTLVLQKGRSLDQVALQSVLAVAGALVDEVITKRGENAFCYLIPFRHDLGKGVELDVWHSIVPLTWPQLRTVIRGLQLFQVDGKRPYSYHFEIHDSNTHGVYTRIGLGNIRKPSNFPTTELLRTAPSSLSASTAKRTVNLPPATPHHMDFPVPGSRLILRLEPRAAIRPDSVKAILLTSDMWVARKISMWGEDGDAPFIFDYGTGDKPYTRLLAYSSEVKNLTWGLLKTVIDGLWIALVEELGFQYTFFEIYDSKVYKKFRLGWGAIVQSDASARKPLIGVTALNLISNSTSRTSLSTSKRAVHLSPAEGLPTLNVSDPIATIIFHVPASDIRLVIQNLTNPPYDCPRRALVSMLISAATALNRDIDKFGEETPSAGQEYVTTMPGVELRLLKVFRPPRGYLTYDQLRTVLLGLQLYMALGRRPQAIRFKVLFREGNNLLGQGAVQAIGGAEVPTSRAADS